MIHERLTGDLPDMTIDEARDVLVRAGAQFVVEAIADNPHGPVRMVTDVEREAVLYEVDVGSGDEARCIWHRSVAFGMKESHQAGGAAFVAAARMQEAVAWAAMVAIEGFKP